MYCRYKHSLLHAGSKIHTRSIASYSNTPLNSRMSEEYSLTVPVDLVKRTSGLSIDIGQMISLKYLEFIYITWNCVINILFQYANFLRKLRANTTVFNSLGLYVPT